MRLMIVEDNDPKFEALKAVVSEVLDGNSLEIDRAKTMIEATRNIYQSEYDLIIVDLMLPARTGAIEQDLSDEILEVLSQSTLNANTRAIAITGFSELLGTRARSFNEINVPVVHYLDNEGAWKAALIRELKEIKNASLFDFVIFTALEKEREAFQYTTISLGDNRLIRGLDCVEVSLNGRRGVIVKPPRMGMTDTSIIVTRAIEAFQPRIVCMSGICAGIPGESSIGDVIVAENCFDYQVGKWTTKGFEFELYQVSIPESVRAILSLRLTNDEVNSAIRATLGFPELSGKKVKFVTHASGSAVVADREKREEICAQHRKLASVEMEIFSLYRAANLSIPEPLFFAAKGVVDDAGESKGDKYHVYGATSAARLVIFGLEALLNELVYASSSKKQVG